jgi:hypothetical protein
MRYVRACVDDEEEKRDRADARSLRPFLRQSVTW